ncbi:MAG: hypothetical protein R3261_13905, partial [Alphaproteobacteria bacterium]|nr:hypothetical protein [Alphaproteobacteria bacterium]
YADDILLLIADKRFCRSIVETSPGTALAVFLEIGETKKYGVQVGIFAKNIVNEALVNKESFLFHEAEGYESGFMGHTKPLSQAMFSNYRMVESIGSLLDPDYRELRDWDANQLEAYCRIVLMTLKDYVDKRFRNHSNVLFRAKGNIEQSVNDLYKIDGISINVWDKDVKDRLRVVVEFTRDAIEILELKGGHESISLRDREPPVVGTFFDQIASMIFEVIYSASSVRSPADNCWWIQHNSVWSKLFNFRSLNGSAARIVKFKVCRLIYNEVVEMNRFPNFKSASILGFCLNVMGLSFRSDNYFRDSNALHKAILSWTKKNFAWLHAYNPRVAEACLVDGLSYDQENLKLIKKYPEFGLRREAKYVYFDVDPPTAVIADH